MTLIRSFLKSADSSKMFSGYVRLRPSRPHLPGVVWDINQVLSHIKTLNHNKELTLLQLSVKLTFLICTTRQRGDIMGIHLDHILRDANCFVCQLQVLSKTYSLRNTSVQTLEIIRFPADKRIYPYNTLCWYLYRTKSLWRSCKWLLITTTRKLHLLQYPAGLKILCQMQVLMVWSTNHILQEVLHHLSFCL